MIEYDYIKNYSVSSILGTESKQSCLLLWNYIISERSIGIPYFLVIYIVAIFLIFASSAISCSNILVLE